MIVGKIDQFHLFTTFGPFLLHISSGAIHDIVSLILVVVTEHWPIYNSLEASKSERTALTSFDLKTKRIFVGFISL